MTDKDKDEVKQGPELELKVSKAMPEDAEKGIIRFDSKAMQEIGVAPGDIVHVQGKRLTVAVAAKAYPSDVGMGVVRIDGLLRKNSEAGIGETVKLSKADIKEAEKVVIAPAQKGLHIQIQGGGMEKSLMGRPVMKGDMVSPLRASQQRMRDPLSDIFSSMLGGGFSPMSGFPGLKFVVANTKPKGAVIITDRTEVVVNPEAVEMTEMEKIPSVTYEDIGGCGDAISKVREMIELPLKHPELFEKLGVEPPKGVLLYGPPGTGKTLLAKAVANETSSNFFVINGPELMSKFYGQSEENMRKVFEDAEKNSPSIIFIDEIDAIAPKREEVTGEVERRVVAQLLALMDGMKSRGKVVVIAATNRQDSIDTALRRGGRFDREIEIGVPDRKGRKEVLQIHTRAMPLAEDVNLNKWADVTYGYVGADVEALVKEAAMSALREILPNLNLEENSKVPQDVLDKLRVSNKDFQNGLKNVSPSAMREVLVEIPKVKWEEVGGLEEAKQQLKEAVEWPLKNPQMFKRMGIEAPRGILLYGPPGTGKTMMAKAVANESNANFISVKGPELLSKWVGESERGIRKIFKKARQVAPSIIFFDELDSLAPMRGRESGAHVTETVVNQLLTELDGMEDLGSVVVLASTNRPDMIDPGLLRPGRFDRHVLIPVPDEAARKKILEVHTKKMPLTKDVKLDKLAELTEEFVGADIAGICKEAAMTALRDDLKAKEVKMKNFTDAIEALNPTMNDEMKMAYEKILMRFKKTAGSGVSKDDLKYMR